MSKLQRIILNLRLQIVNSGKNKWHKWDSIPGLGPTCDTENAKKGAPNIRVPKKIEVEEKRRI